MRDKGKSNPWKKNATPAQGGETDSAKGDEAYQKIKLYIKKANDCFFLINKFIIFAGN